MHKGILLSCLLAAVAASAGTPARAIVGSATNTCAVAVALDYAVYAASRNATLSNLRVLDGKGVAQPRIILTRRDLRHVVNTVWHALAIDSLSMTNDTLTVFCSRPATDTNEFPAAGIRISTPLKDFEQLVNVFGPDGKPCATQAIYDYTKFADVRKTDIPFRAESSRRFRLVFTRPESIRTRPSIDHTVETDGAQKITKEVKRYSVEERPFRLDAIAVAREIPSIVRGVATSAPMDLACTTAESADNTAFLISACYAPIQSVRFNVNDQNFSRSVKLEFLHAGQWQALSRGSISAMHLPGASQASLLFSFPPEREEDKFRITVENSNNPPLAFRTPPLTFSVIQNDLIFIAQPGESYRLAFAKDSDKSPPRNDQLLAYFDKGGKFTSWSLAPAAPIDLAEPSALAQFFSKHGLALLSFAILAVLGATCLKLLKNPGEKEQPF